MKSTEQFKSRGGSAHDGTEGNKSVRRLEIKERLTSEGLDSGLWSQNGLSATGGFHPEPEMNQD